MGKIKVKRKSTLIDMTAMSDVTVLLLTFFMLTSTFLQKEPTQVLTPPSVSTNKVEISNVAKVLVGTNEAKDKVRVFINITGEADPNIPEDNPGAYSSENMRANALRMAAAEYEALTGRNPGITEKDLQVFSKIGTFGVPMMKMHEFLSMSQTEQDKFVGDMENDMAGIPLANYIPDKNGTYKGQGENINEFQIWMRALQNSGNPALTEAMRLDGSGIAVKADRSTPFVKVNEVLESLRTIKLNKFTVETALIDENAK